MSPPHPFKTSQAARRQSALRWFHAHVPIPLQDWQPQRDPGTDPLLRFDVHRGVRCNSTELYNDAKPHIGIDNIRQRLAFLYGDAARMEISSEINVGTNIVITFPINGSERTTFDSR